MIPFQSWLSQIIGYCHFVTDAVGMRRAWIEGNFSHTSVTNFDELYEQIFEDLDSDAIETELASRLANDGFAREAISAFLDAIRNADAAREKRTDLANPERLLCSDEWCRIVKAAERVMAIFEGAGVDQSS